MSQQYDEVKALAARGLRCFPTSGWEYNESDLADATADEVALAFQNATRLESDWAVDAGNKSRLICLRGKVAQFAALEAMTGRTLPQSWEIGSTDNTAKRNTFRLYVRQREQRAALAHHVRIKDTGVDLIPFALLPGSRLTKRAFAFWLTPRIVTPLAALPPEIFARLPRERNRLARTKAQAPESTIELPQTLDIIDVPEFDPAATARWDDGPVMRYAMGNFRDSYDD